VRYYRHVWSESRGDEHQHWGRATYYFAVDDDAIVVEQAEVYENGSVLIYDQQHPQDEFGMLADQRFKPVEGSEELDAATYRGVVSKLERGPRA
jgi:hypothetical protein